MEKKSVLIIILVLSIVLFSSVVLANVNVVGTSVLSPANVTNSSIAKVVMALQIWDNSSGTLDSVVISGINLSGMFTADGDLAPLSSDSTSGVQIYKDGNSNGVYDSGTDTRLTYTVSDWSSVANNRQNVTFSGISGLTLPSSKPSIANVFIIIRTAGAASDEAQFNITLEQGSIKSSANSTGSTNSTPIGSGRIYVDTSNPGFELLSFFSDVRVNDTDRDGYVDQIRVVLDEAINDTGIISSGFSVGNISNFTINSGYLAAGVTFWTGSETSGANDNIFYLNFTEVTEVRFTNQSTIAINYSTNGSIKDVAGNSLQSFTNQQAFDGAGPIVLNITTNDTNLDGRVDLLTFIFSEFVNDSSINLSSLGLTATNFTIANSTTTVTANDMDISVVVNQVNSTRDGNLTGTFSVNANKVGFIKDRSQINELLADELDNWAGNITTFAILDKVSPVFEAFEIVDTDLNGWVDAIRLNLSEPIDDSKFSLANLQKWDITGEFNNSGAKQNVTFFINGTSTAPITSTYFGDVANNSFFYLNFSESLARFNTSGLMRINYTVGPTSQGGPLTDMAGNTIKGNSSNSLTTDKAAPIIMSGLTYNLTSNDSTIDYINLTLSEIVVSGNVASSGFSLAVNTNNTNGTSSIANGLVITTNNISANANAANLTIGFNGLVVGTGNVTLNYTGTAINDSAGNFMPTQLGISITDGLRPVLYSADYLDNDSNGLNDAVRLNFTEQLLDSSVNNAVNIVIPASRNFSVQRISNDSGANLNFTNDLNATGVNALTQTGTADNIIYLTWKGDFVRTYQTNGTMIINITGTGAGFGGNSLTDTAGLGFDNVSNFNVNDKASPVITSAITYDMDLDGRIDGVNLTLSENLANGGVMNLSAFSLVVTDGKITGKNILSISQAFVSTATGNVSLIMSDAVTGTGNVTLNYTSPTTGGNINDSSGNIMKNLLSFTVIDGVIPKIMNRLTLDTDGNGWLDGIILNFSEEINDSSILQQLDQQNGRNINLSITGISKELGGHNLNFSTYATANDALVVLTWNHTNSTLNQTHNTGATPSLNYTLGVVSDTNALLLATNASTTTTTATDLALPKIMDRFTVDLDLNGYIDAVGINFSENINDQTFNGTSATNNASAWNISGISGNALLVDFTTNYNGDTLNNNIVYLNWTFVNTLYKTNGTPTVNYTATNSNVSDLVNNLLATTLSGVGALDRVAPRIMNITTIDNDSNGWLDAVAIYWSEPINDNTFKGLDFNVSGVGYSTATAIVGSPDSHALNFTPTYNGDLLNDDVIYINWSFNNSKSYHGIHNTGATPQINYTAGNLSDLNNVLAVTNTTNAGTTSLDRAVPRIMDIFTVDNNTNGYLDAVGINWSESVNDQTFTNVTNFNVSKINSIASSLRVDFTTNYHGDSLNNNIIYLNWTTASTTFNTSELPLLNYTAGNLSDLVNNKALTNSSSVISQDRSAPGIIGFVASDNSTGINSYDSDDTLTLSFSEAINNASLNNNSIFIVNGSNVDGIEGLFPINGTKKWNNISSALWINANQTLVITLHSQNFTNLSVGDVITPNGTLRDSFGNLMGLSTATLTGTFDDTASPQVTNIETHDNNSNGRIDSIRISFSETIVNRTYNSGAANGTTYLTGFTVGFDAGNTFTVTAGQNDSGTVILLNLTEKTAFNTSMRPWVSYTSNQGNLTDLGTNANRLVTFNLTSNDSIMPVPVNVSTYDNDSDGMIDMINVTFSEEINDSSINVSNLFIGSTTQLSKLGGILFNTRNGALASANDSYVEFAFADHINNTGEVPQFVSNGTGAALNSNFVVQDLSTTSGGNYLKLISNTTVIESDGSKPVFMPLNVTSGHLNFSNTSKLGNNNITTLWFNVSENVVRLVAVVGNVTLTLQNNESAGFNYTYRFIASTTNSTEGSKTITLSALDTVGNNGTNATQAITLDFTGPTQITSVNVSDRANDDGKHLKVIWAQSTDADFNRYRVYLDVNALSSVASKQPHNISFTTNASTRTVIGGINTSNLTDGTTYYVAVTAVDDVGNENTTVINGSSISYDNAQVTPTVNQWNLISTTQTLQNTTKSASFNSSYTLWYYNASSSAWESPTVVDQYRGYWLYDNGVNLSVNLSFKNNEGPSPTLGQANLSLGWNLIGASREAATAVNTSLKSIEGKYSVVYEYTVGVGWRTHTPGSTTTDSATEFTTMTTGRGYWIYMTTSGTYSGGDL